MYLLLKQRSKGRCPCLCQLNAPYLWDCRVGWPLRLELVFAAARNGKHECLAYMLENHPDILSSEEDRKNAMYSAAAGGSLKCVDHLERAGCTWNQVGPPGFEVAYKRNPARFLLDPRWADGQGNFEWELAMRRAIEQDNARSLSLLYSCGLQAHIPASPMRHPANQALKKGSSACLILAVKRSEHWPPGLGKKALTMLAARAGQQMLRPLLRLGIPLHPLTLVICARRGDVGSLQWLSQMPGTIKRCAKAAICEAAVMGNSIECLRFARQRGYLQGDITEPMASACNKYRTQQCHSNLLLQWDDPKLLDQNFDLDLLGTLCSTWTHSGQPACCPMWRVSWSVGSSVAKWERLGVRRSFATRLRLWKTLRHSKSNGTS